MSGNLIDRFSVDADRSLIRIIEPHEQIDKGGLSTACRTDQSDPGAGLGMQESGIIISINNDPDAPINTIADYVINGSIEEVVPKMIKYYKQNSK